MRLIPCRDGLLDRRETNSGDLTELRTTAARIETDAIEECNTRINALVVAFAGLTVHDVHEAVSFVLFDLTEMSDGNRLVDPLSHLAPFVPYLVAVLSPDHSGAFGARTRSNGYRAVRV